MPEPGGLRNVVTSDEKVSVELNPASGTRVLYTTDGTTPGDASPAYSKPIEISLKPREVVTLKTIVVEPGGRKSSVYAATIAIIMGLITAVIAYVVQLRGSKSEVR